MTALLKQTQNLFKNLNITLQLSYKIKLFKIVIIYWHVQVTIQYILNKIINAPCGTLKLLLALGVAKYIKSYKINFVVQYATDYCPLEHDNYKTISAHLGSPISCYINNLHGAFIFLLSVEHVTQQHDVNQGCAQMLRQSNNSKDSSVKCQDCTNHKHNHWHCHAYRLDANTKH